MANTNKGFFYPVSSDVPDIPLHMQTLATDVDEYFDGVSTASKTETLTNKTISGSSNTISNIGNSSLTNSSITINGSPTSLGDSINISSVPDVSGNDGKILKADPMGAFWDTISNVLGSTGNEGKYLKVGTTGDVEWGTVSGGGTTLPDPFGQPGILYQYDGTLNNLQWLPLSLISIPSKVSTVNVTSNSATSILAGLPDIFKSAIFSLSIVQGSKTRTCQVSLAMNGSSTSVTEYGVSSVGAAIPITFSATVSGGMWTFSATITDAASTNATINGSYTAW